MSRTYDTTRRECRALKLFADPDLLQIDGSSLFLVLLNKRNMSGPIEMRNPVDLLSCFKGGGIHGPHSTTRK